VPPQTPRDREPVHLHEQLVDDAHPAAAAHAGAHEDPVGRPVTGAVGRHGAPRTDGVDLVDEDHGPAVLVRHDAALLEQLAHLQVPDSHEHVREAGPRGEQERHAGGSGDRLGHQRLAGAGRALEQDAVGRVPAHLLEVLEALEDPQHLLGRLDGRRLTPHVVEGRVVLVGVDHVVVAARQEPEQRSELQDDEEDQDQRLEHERSELRHDE
jgi:hypothetical protein